MVVGGVVAWLTRLAFNIWTKRDAAEARRIEIDHKNKVHDEGILLQLLNAAREEITDLRSGLKEYAAIERRVAHFDESLRHIEALVVATDETRAFALLSAQQFLDRMDREHAR